MYYINKKKGQIFLKNNIYVKKIINNINCNINDILIEIGPGKGVLTKKLKLLTNKFICVEIDKKLVKFLKNNILNKNNKIFNMSILDYKLNFKNKVIIIGNIPYYITKKILYWILYNHKKILYFICLLQKEVANNLLLKDKKISKISIILNLFFNIKFLLNIKNTNFYPIPKVDSTLLKFIPKFNNININLFLFFIKKIFKKKRKKIYNSLNLKKYYKYKIFNKRIEELSLKKIVKLYKFLLKNKCLNQDM